MIYGYAKRTADPEFGLLELSEVTFNLDPERLRLVAKFLTQAAEEIEAGSLGASHVHLSGAEPTWDADQVADVIVSDPVTERSEGSTSASIL